MATVLVGGVLGLFLGSRLPDHLRATVIAGLGLFTAAIGLQFFIDTQSPIIVLAALLFGGILGELARIEDRLANLGEWLQKRFAAETEGGSMRFVRGFLTASLVFCVGPMTILGSVQDGISGDFQLLAVKSILDGFAAIVFASTLGIGVLFSVLVILVYQGSLTLLATQAQAVFSPEMITELTATGGILLLGIAISTLLEIKPIRVANFLPALVIAPLIVYVLMANGIPLSP